MAIAAPIGKSPRDERGPTNDWTSGVPIGIAWDEVVSYYAMTPEQFETKMKEHWEGEF